MSARSVEVDGQPWQDGWVGVDQASELWRLTFLPSTWGPVHDRWVWEQFGTKTAWSLDDPGLKHPLTKVWPLESTPTEKPAPKRRASQS